MRVNTRSVDFTRVQLHALPTQCPRTAHALPANTTRRLHAFYARVGAAIPLTGTVYHKQCDQLPVWLIAQLVDHCTSIAEIMGWNPIQT